VLDTCVVSELAKPKPNAELVRWFAYEQADELFLSAINEFLETSIGRLRAWPAVFPERPRPELAALDSVFRECLTEAWHAQ
jgi:predicted nucleic acid-binding protein